MRRLVVMVVLVALTATAGCKGQRESRSKTTCERYRDFARQDESLGGSTKWSCRDGALNAMVEHLGFRNHATNRFDLTGRTRFFVRTFVAKGYNPREDRLRINVQHRTYKIESTVTGKVTRTNGPVFFASYYDPDKDAVGACGLAKFENGFALTTEHVHMDQVEVMQEAIEPITGKNQYRFLGWDAGENGGEPDCHREWLATQRDVKTQ